MVTQIDCTPKIKNSTLHLKGILYRLELTCLLKKNCRQFRVVLWKISYIVINMIIGKARLEVHEEKMSKDKVAWTSNLTHNLIRAIYWGLAKSSAAKFPQKSRKLRPISTRPQSGPACLRKILLEGPLLTASNLLNNAREFLNRKCLTLKNLALYNTLSGLSKRSKSNIELPYLIVWRRF